MNYVQVLFWFAIAKVRKLQGSWFILLGMVYVHPMYGSIFLEDGTALQSENKMLQAWQNPQQYLPAASLSTLTYEGIKTVSKEKFHQVLYNTNCNLQKPLLLCPCKSRYCDIYTPHNGTEHLLVAKNFKFFPASCVIVHRPISRVIVQTNIQAAAVQAAKSLDKLKDHQLNEIVGVLTDNDVLLSIPLAIEKACSPLAYDILYTSNWSHLLWSLPRL